MVSLETSLKQGSEKTKLKLLKNKKKMNVILITFVNITSSARIFGWRKTNKKKQTKKKKDIRTSVCRIRLKKKSEYKHEMMWSDVVSSVDALGYVEIMS